MNHNHFWKTDRSATISFDLPIQTAKDTGALGAKLTGGGRGGCMIALAQTKQKPKKSVKHLKMRVRLKLGYKD